MSTIKLIGMMYSSGFKKECLLIVEVLLSTLIMMAVIYPLSTEYLQIRRLEKEFPEVVHTIQTAKWEQGGPELSIEEITKRYLAADKVYWADRVYLSGMWEHETLLYILSEDLYNDAALQMKVGKAEKTHESGRIPLVVNSALERLFPIGTEVDLPFGSLGEDNDHTVHLPGIVTGVLSDQCYIKTVNGATSTKGLMTPSASVSEGGYDKAVLLAIENERFPSSGEKRALLFHFPQSEDRQKIEENTDLPVGYVSKTYEMLRRQTFTNLISQNESIRLLLIVFGVVLLINYGGYLVAFVCQRNRFNSLLMICGLSQKRLIILLTASVMLLVIPAAAVGMIISKYTTPFLLGPDYSYQGINWILIAAGAVIMLSVTISAFWAAWFTWRKATVMSLYR